MRVAGIAGDKIAPDLPHSAVKRIVATARAVATTHLRVELGGEAIEQTERPNLARSELVGLVTAAETVPPASDGYSSTSPVFAGTSR